MGYTNPHWSPCRVDHTEDLLGPCVRKVPDNYDFTFETAGYSWVVIVSVKHSRSRVTNGWAEYVRANDFRVGTILKLEYVRVHRNRFMITVVLEFVY